MKHNFTNKNWEEIIPIPICDEKIEYFEFYKKHGI